MWGQLIELGVASGMISFIISEAKLFLPFREYLKPRSKFFYGLFSCGLCLGVWMTLIISLVFFHHFSFELFIIRWFDLAYLSAIFWIVLCLLIDKAGK